MTFIDYLNRLSRLARQHHLTASERGFYVTLLTEFNALHWPEYICITDNQFCGELGICKSSLYSIRNRLKQVGLINFMGGRGKGPTRYYLAEVKVARKNSKVSVENFKVYSKGSQTDFRTNSTTDSTTDFKTDFKRDSHIIYRKEDKDKDIDKDISTDVDVEKGTPSSTSTLKKEILKEIDILKSDREWLDSLQTACRRSQEELLEEITFFGAHCISYDRRHSSIGDAKRHFCDWLRKRPSKKSAQNGLKNDNTYGSFRPFYGKPQPGCGLIE